VESLVQVIAAELSPAHCTVFREQDMMVPEEGAMMSLSEITGTDANATAAGTTSIFGTDVKREPGFLRDMFAGYSQDVIVKANDEFGNQRNVEQDLFILQVFDYKRSASGGEEIDTIALVEQSSKLEVEDSMMQHRLIVSFTDVYAGRKFFQLRAGGISIPLADGPYIRTVFCAHGFYPNDISGVEDGCVRCQDGLTCAGNKQFTVLPSYWVSPHATECTSGACLNARIYKCEVAQGCQQSNLTQRTAITPDDIPALELCTSGYRKNVIMCSKCQPGYDKDVRKGCKKCPDNALVPWLQLGGIILAFMLMTVIVYK
jgi:hypothetical protein